MISCIYNNTSDNMRCQSYRVKKYPYNVIFGKYQDKPVTENHLDIKTATESS